MSTDLAVSAPAPWQPIHETLSEFRQGCGGLDQVLESMFGELEQMREEVVRKARELQHEHSRIADERRQLHEQQAIFCEELRQLRNQLEVRPTAQAAAVAPQAQGPVGDPVIDSVMAQFSKLQKQIAQRRESQKHQRGS